MWLLLFATLVEFREIDATCVDDDAAVKFFARIIKGLKQCGETMEVEFSQPFCNLKKRDEGLFNEVMQRLLANTYKDSDTPLWNKIMDELGVEEESFYLVREESDGESGRSICLGSDEGV